MAASADCHDLEAQLLDYVYGELAPSEARAFEQRLAACPECAAKVASMQSLRKAVALPEEPPPEAGLASLMEYAGQQATRMAAPKPSKWMEWFRFAVPVGAVAVIAAVLAPQVMQRAPSASLASQEETVGAAQPATPVVAAAPAAKTPVAKALAEEAKNEPAPPPAVAAGEIESPKLVGAMGGKRAERDAETLGGGSLLAPGDAQADAPTDALKRRASGSVVATTFERKADKAGAEKARPDLEAAREKAVAERQIEVAEAKPEGNAFGGLGLIGTGKGGGGAGQAAGFGSAGVGRSRGDSSRPASELGAAVATNEGSVSDGLSKQQARPETSAAPKPVVVPQQVAQAQPVPASPVEMESDLHSAKKESKRESVAVAAPAKDEAPREQRRAATYDDSLSDRDSAAAPGAVAGLDALMRKPAPPPPPAPAPEPAPAPAAKTKAAATQNAVAGPVPTSQFEEARVASDKGASDAEQRWIALFQSAPNGPGAPEALYRAGEAAWAKGHVDAALRHWERTADLFASSPWAAQALDRAAGAAERSGRASEASRLASRRRALAPAAESSGTR